VNVARKAGRGKLDWLLIIVLFWRWFLTVFTLEPKEIGEICSKRLFGEARINFLLCYDDHLA